MNYGPAAARPCGANGLTISGQNVDLQIGNLRVDAADQSPVILNAGNNRVFIHCFRAERWNSSNNGAPAFSFRNTLGFNHISLSAFPVLGNGGNGPLSNATPAKGFVSSTVPGSTSPALPGLMVGYTDTGLFNTSPNALGASAGGKRGLLLDSSGHVELGYANGQPVTSLAPFQLATFSSASLPSPASYPRCMIYVLNANGSGHIAFSDGTSWRTLSVT